MKTLTYLKDTELETCVGGDDLTAGGGGSGGGIPVPIYLLKNLPNGDTMYTLDPVMAAHFGVTDETLVNLNSIVLVKNGGTFIQLP